MLLESRRQIRPTRALLCAAWLACGVPALARAAETGGLPPSPAQDLDARRRQRDDADAAVSTADAQRKATETDVEAIRADRARLGAALIDTTAQVRAAEDRVSEAEQKLDLLTGRYR